LAKGDDNGQPNGHALFEAANKLRGLVESAEYKQLVLGLIFLKYISDAFEQRRGALEAELSDAKSKEYVADPLARAEELDDRDAYVEKQVFWVPEQARWPAILASASSPDIAKHIDDALSAIEGENRELRRMLPLYSRAPSQQSCSARPWRRLQRSASAKARAKHATSSGAPRVQATGCAARGRKCPGHQLLCPARARPGQDAP
jgi:hypothetical protein